MAKGQERIDVLVSPTSHLLHFAGAETSAWWTELLPSMQRLASGTTQIHMHVAVDDLLKATLQEAASNVCHTFPDITACTLVKVAPHVPVGSSDYKPSLGRSLPSYKGKRIHDWHALIHSLETASHKRGANSSIVILLDDSAKFICQDWDTRLVDVLLQTPTPSLFANNEDDKDNQGGGCERSAMLRLVPLQLVSDEFPSPDELVRCGPFLHWQRTDQSFHDNHSATDTHSPQASHVAFNLAAHRVHFGCERTSNNWWSSISTLMCAYGILDCLAWLQTSLLERNLVCWYSMPQHSDQSNMLRGVNTALAAWPRRRKKHLVQILDGLHAREQFASVHYIATRMLHSKPAFKYFRRIAMHALDRVWRSCEPNSRISALLTSELQHEHEQPSRDDEWCPEDISSPSSSLPAPPTAQEEVSVPVSDEDENLRVVIEVAATVSQEVVVLYDSETAPKMQPTGK